MGIEEKNESLSTLEAEVTKLNEREVYNEELITKLETELAELRNNDKLDKAMEQMPLEKLKTYYENYNKVQTNLKSFNDVISKYMTTSKNNNRN
mmetsp:Transcript_6103/g.12953  ORF Transcript_6103/g.12953 Transcript_6103/m.12953 type:complete len:94 (+) Transcript_6103:1173-1454(+)